MLLYYKASQRKLDELAKEEKEMEEAKRKEKEKRDKKDLCELASKPPDHREEPAHVKDEEGDYEEYRQEGEDKDGNDEEEEEESSEAAEEGNPLTLSESKKVTRAKSGNEPGAQVPWFSGLALPGVHFYKNGGQSMWWA